VATRILKVLAVLLLMFFVQTVMHGLGRALFQHPVGIYRMVTLILYLMPAWVIWLASERQAKET
jgi:hypothetical protein